MHLPVEEKVAGSYPADSARLMACGDLHTLAFYVGGKGPNEYHRFQPTKNVRAIARPLPFLCRLITLAEMKLKDKGFIIEQLNNSYSVMEFCKRVGNSGLDKILNRNKLSDFIGVDITKTIEANRERRKKDELERFLNKVFVCDFCGKEYRNGEHLQLKCKSGRHFCSNLCARRYSSAAANTEEKRLQKSIKMRGKYYGDRNEAKVRRRKYGPTNKKIIKIRRQFLKYMESPEKCEFCGADKPYARRDRKTCCKECELKLRGIKISKRLKGTVRTGGFREKSSRGKCGHYKGVFCASTYELAFLVFCMDHGIRIERNTKGYKYEWNGVVHTYYPDWIIDGSFLVETKNYITDLVEAKADAVDDMPITILDTTGLADIFRYVAKKYGMKLCGRSNNFYELYDENVFAKCI